MKAVRELKKWARAAIVVLAIVDAAAAVVLLSPIAGFRAAKLREDQALRKQWQEETRNALPVRDIDQKIQEARAQVSQFYDERFPDRTSAVAVELGKVAADNGVRLSNVRYQADDESVEGLRRLQMDATLSGDYVKVVQFINALERDKMFILVNSVGLAERAEGAVTLQVHLETYLKES